MTGRLVAIGIDLLITVSILIHIGLTSAETEEGPEVATEEAAAETEEDARKSIDSFIHQQS